MARKEIPGYCLKKKKYQSPSVTAINFNVLAQIYPVPHVEKHNAYMCMCTHTHTCTLQGHPACASPLVFTAVDALCDGKASSN